MSKIKIDQKDVIYSIILASINVVFIVYVLVVTVIKAVNPIKGSDLLFPVALGTSAKKFAIMLGIILLILLTILIFSCLKKFVVYIIHIIILPFLLIFCLVGNLIVEVMQNATAFSYTNNIDNYETYDEFVDREIDNVVEYLPEKEKVKKYEYILDYREAVLAPYSVFVMYIKTEYDEDILEAISSNEKFKLYEDVSDPLLEEYMVYKTTFDRNDNVDLDLYILINEFDNKIIYSITTGRAIFKIYNNPYCIRGFITGDRDNPYFIYE